MAEMKHVIILANSIRAKKRCIAGKELTPKGGGEYEIGPWIRMTDPDAADGAVSDQSTMCPGHGFTRVFDLVRIHFREKCNNADHPEDWWFEPDHKWEFVERRNMAMLPSLADNPPELWNEGYGNDCVPAGHVPRMGANAATLYLIKAPAQWTFDYWKELDSYTGKIDKRRRLKFSYAGADHDFSVTDPAFTSRYRVYDKMTEQPQTLVVPKPTEAYFCLSLTPELNRKHYKICATIFEQ